MPTDFLTGPLAQAVGLTLLHTLWQGAIIAAIAAAALALLRNSSSAVRYTIACAALALVVVMAAGTAVELYQPRTFEPVAQPTTIAPAPLPDGTVVISLRAPAPTWRDRAMQLVDATRAHVPQIVMIWLAGVLLLTVRLAVSWWRVQSMTRTSAIEADERWQRTAKRLAEAMHLERPVRLVVSTAVEVPSVIGWLKPVVLIAASSVSGLTAEQLEMVLAHELAHIRRHDFLVNAIQSVVETLLFYNPAVWWISRQIRIERENCCDDLAVSICGDPVAYARALAQLEAMRAVPSAAAAANGGSLVDRVRRLVGSQSERSLFSTGWTAAAAVTSFLLLLGLATAPLFAARPADAKPQAAGTKVDVTAQAPKAKPAPAPKADDESDNSDDDEGMNIDMNIVAPDPPEPPVMPRRMHIVVPRIKAEAFAGVQAALANMEHMGFDEPDSSPAPPGKLSVNELIELKIQNITPEYVGAVRSTFPGASIHEVVAMKMQGVTPDYVSAMKAAGAPIKSAHDAIALKMQDVQPDFVRQLVAAGYDHLTVHDIVRLKMVGIDGNFIREMSKYKNK